MNDTLLYALIMLFSLFELAILGGVLVFYMRLRRSEGLLNALQGNQDSLLARIEMNARLEKEIVATFAQRRSCGIWMKSWKRARMNCAACWNRPRASAVRPSFCGN